MNLPILRFRAFNDTWEETSFRGIGHFYYGKSAPKWSVEKDAKTPCVRYGELYTKFDGIVDRIYSYTNISPNELKFSKGGEVLIPRVGEDPLDFSKASYLPIPNIAIGEMISVFNTKQYGLFLVHYIRAKLKKSFARLVEGGNVSNLYFSYLEDVAINIPTIEEQTKIANFLTAVDEKISQLTQKCELLAQYKKGVMQKIFSQELRFRDDDGQEFPEWIDKSLSNLGNSFNGLTGKSGDDFGSGKPYITYKQIFDNAFIDTSKFSLVQVSNNEKQNKVKYGDVFFTTSSETPEEVGFCSVLMSHVEDVYLNSFCFGYRIKSFEVLAPSFAGYLFKSPSFRRDVIKLAQGSTRYNISKTNFMKIIIKLPCIKEQSKIANFLSAIDDKLTHTQAQLAAAKQYKQGLLQQMFV